MRGCIIAGIGTGVGKTITAAIFAQRYAADYWKPVQAGDLAHTDSHAVKALAPDVQQIHPEAYRLTAAMSPHAAAAIDGVTIDLEHLRLPATSRFLVVELAGGLMVPLHTQLTNLDLVSEWQLPVVLVASYYLGSINHTLLSIDALFRRNIDIAGLVFNGETNPASRSVILGRTGLICLLDLPAAPRVDTAFIRACAARIKEF
jgi:dethiobiotin synthetase